MSDIINRIKEMAAKGSNKYTWEDLKKIRAEEERKQADVFKRQFEQHKSMEAIGRSGILPLHLSCTVSNFVAEGQAQTEAKMFAKNYVLNFESNNGQGFIFSGNSGTGKNHLAAAICNALIKRNHSCLVITVNELMQKLRNCYSKDSKTTEDEFFRTMINFDLLVLDEIGLGRQNDNERLALNQIIDQRVGRMKSTGMLTNLPADGDQSMTSVLGVRIMDRMKMNGGRWISFDWGSYRK